MNQNISKTLAKLIVADHIFFWLEKVSIRVHTKSEKERGQKICVICQFHQAHNIRHKSHYLVSRRKLSIAL